MKRRAFIAGLGGAVAWPRVARAQQPGEIRRVGVLMDGTATEANFQSELAAFVQGLRQLGWTEGQNLRMDVRWDGGDPALGRIYAAQLIGLLPDVILTASTPNLTVIREATSTVPVVFLRVSDPVAQGFVASMTRPGANVTGFSAYEFSIGGKWLDLLKEVAPSLSLVAVMFNPETSPQSKFFIQAIEAAAPSLGVRTITMPVRAIADIEPAVANFARQPNGGLVMPTDGFTLLHQMLISDLAGRYRLPSIGGTRYARDGGLLEYGVSIGYVSQFRQAATYVDRILKGSKPGDLPVQAPTKYRLVINMKTAKALGLNVPLPLLGLADEVIE